MNKIIGTCFPAAALLAIVACGSQPSAPTANRPAKDPIAAAPAVRQTAEIRELRFREPTHPLPEGAPEALAYMPARFDRSAPYSLVIFFHGWNGCVAVLVNEEATPCVAGGPTHEGWGLGTRLTAPQRVMIFPQLAFRQRSGSPGRFSDPGVVADWLEQVRRQLELSHPETLFLMPHSAGGNTVLTWLQSGVSINGVALMDSLYSGAPQFAEWLAADPSRHLVSLTTGGSTGRQQRRLAALGQRSRLSQQMHLRRTHSRHAVVPYEDGPAALLRLGSFNSEAAERAQ